MRRVWWGVKRASERVGVAVGTTEMTAAGVDTGPGGAEGPTATVSLMPEE